MSATATQSNGFKKLYEEAKTRRAAREAGITVESFRLFLAYAKDAGNWGGTPLVGGNVSGSVEHRGNLTQLKKAELVRTFYNGGDAWVKFLPAGIALAKANGIDL